MNELHLIVVDVETGGLKSDFHEVIQIAGKAYTPEMEEIPAEEGGEFCSLMRPEHFDRLQDGAMRVNKIKVSDLRKAPSQKEVYQQFVEWCLEFNPRGNSPFTAPMIGGKNIQFDIGFLQALNAAYYPDKRELFPFHPRHIKELEQMLFDWFWCEKEPAKFNMDYLREYFGMSTDSAHHALIDCRQTGTMITTILKLHRKLQRDRLIKFDFAC